VNIDLKYLKQESEQNQADKYAEMALAADRYNPAGIIQMDISS